MPDLLTDFSRNYDALMFDPRNHDIYGDSNFFNVGFWPPGTNDQRAACHNLVARLLDTVPHDVARLLDVGCGCGGSTAAAKQLRPATDVIGINISERQLRQCRTAAPGCNFVHMNATGLAYPSDTFDCVLSAEAVFHFQTRAAFLEEACRVLKPGGHLVLSDILFRDTRWVGDWVVPRENATAAPDDYPVLLREAGFQSVVLANETARCWTAFCRARLAAIRAQWEAGQIDRSTFDAQLGYFVNLMERSVEQYVLVSARKPVSGLAA